MFDDQTFNIPCPECSYKTAITVRELRNHSDPEIVCGGCGRAIRIEASDFRNKLKEVEESWDDLQKKLKNFGWKIS
jgi:hypothetical protein